MIHVEEERQNWIEQTHVLKPYFIEKITDCLREPVHIVHTDVQTIEMHEDKKEDELAHGHATITEVNLSWRLQGGVVYEYIYGVDTERPDSFFTTTSDIDISVKILDHISDEEMVVDTSKLLENSFFSDSILAIVRRLNGVDFSGMDDILDDLPYTEEINSVDNGKVRIVVAESHAEAEIVQHKIQVMISRRGCYDEIADIMVYFERCATTNSVEQKLILGSDGLEREMYYTNLTSMLNSEIDAFIVRNGKCELKAQNHIGRILYILTYVNTEGTKKQKVESCNVCALFITKLTREYRITREALKTKDLIVYKGRYLRITDILRPISKWAIDNYIPAFLLYFTKK